MYLKFTFPDRHMPSELGDGGSESVYYCRGLKVFSNQEEEKLSFLGPFSKLNLFVGANNSGKSRFLRGLLKSDKQMTEISSSEHNIEYWYKQYKKWIGSNHRRIVNLSTSVAHDLANIMQVVNPMQSDYKKNVGNSHVYLQQLEKIISNYSKDIEEIEKATGGSIDVSQKHGGRIRALSKKQELIRIIESLRNEIAFSANNQIESKLYIPILRSIKKSSKIASNTFVDTVKELYDLKDLQCKIFTGLNLFDQILDVRNDLKEKREGFEQFEFFLSNYFFEGKSVEIISNIKEKVIRIYVDREERKIHDVGDGIQSLILLLFPIYTAEKDTWVFIEEPEIHLHPGLQRIFIETLLKDEFLEKKNLRYFFTTHSNHFLDLTIEMDKMAIFQFQKKDLHRYEIKTNVKPDNSILDILGVNSSSVFLANTSVWVEGPTDRKYVSKWLKLYTESKDDEKYLKEDIDFAFFEYGGNLIAHYLFDKDEERIDYNEVFEKINAFSLSNKIILLADQDNAKGTSKKGKRRSNLAKLSGEKENFKYQNTEVIEIENLLPAQIIKDFSNNLVKEEHLEKLDNFTLKKNDYSKKRLGTYYKEKFIELGIPEIGQKSFMANSGTLKNDYKLKLCDYFLDYRIEFTELISENVVLEKIIKDLYGYIKG